MHKSYPSWAPSLAGIVRILLGLAFLYFGIMKLTGDTTMYMSAIESLQNKGLSFIPTNILYWLGIIGEIVAGALLLLGYKTRCGAGIALLIMIFAIIAVGRHQMAIILGLLAGFVKYAGSGNRAMEHEPIGCRGGTCCGGMCGSKSSGCNCKDGSCSCDMQQQ